MGDQTVTIMHLLVSKPQGWETHDNIMKVDDLSVSWPVPDRDVPLQLGLPIKTKFSTLKDEDLFHFRISNHQAIPHSNSKQVFNVKFTKSILYSHGFPMVFLMKMADVSRLFSVKAPNTHRCRPRGAATTPCWCGGRWCAPPRCSLEHGSWFLGLKVRAQCSVHKDIYRYVI